MARALHPCWFCHQQVMPSVVCWSQDQQRKRNMFYQINFKNKPMKPSKALLFSIVTLSLLFSSIGFTPSFAQHKEKGIHFFGGTMNEAFAKAKKEKKIIF